MDNLRSSKKRSCATPAGNALKKSKLEDLDPMTQPELRDVQDLILQHLRGKMKTLSEVSTGWNEAIGRCRVAMKKLQVKVNDQASYEGVMASARMYQDITIEGGTISNAQTVALIEKYAGSLITLSIDGRIISAAPASDESSDEDEDEAGDVNEAGNANEAGDANEATSDPAPIITIPLAKLQSLTCNGICSLLAGSLVRCAGKKLTDLTVTRTQIEEDVIVACLKRSKDLIELNLLHCCDTFMDHSEDFNFHLSHFSFSGTITAVVFNQLQTFVLHQRHTLHHLKLLAEFEHPAGYVVPHAQAIIFTIGALHFGLVLRGQLNQMARDIFTFMVQNLMDLQTFRFEDEIGGAFSEITDIYEEMKDQADDAATFNRNIQLQPFWLCCPTEPPTNM